MIRFVAISTTCRTFCARRASSASSSRVTTGADFPSHVYVGVNSAVSRTSLHEARSYRSVRNDASGRQNVATPPAPRPDPLFVEPQEVGVRAQRGALADLAEDVHIGGELARKFVEHLPKRVVALPCEGTIGAFAELYVIVHVDEAAVEAVGEEPGNEERVVA